MIPFLLPPLDNNDDDDDDNNNNNKECGSKSDTGNSRGDWNHSKITQTVPEQHNRKARN